MELCQAPTPSQARGHKIYAVIYIPLLKKNTVKGKCVQTYKKRSTTQLQLKNTRLVERKIQQCKMKRNKKENEIEFKTENSMLKQT